MALQKKAGNKTMAYFIAALIVAAAFGWAIRKVNQSRSIEERED